MFKCFPVYASETSLPEIMKAYVEILTPFRIQCVERAVMDYCEGRAPDQNPERRPSTAQLAIIARSMNDKINNCERTPAAQMKTYIARFRDSGMWPTEIYGPNPDDPRCFVPKELLEQAKPNPALSR